MKSGINQYQQSFSTKQSGLTSDLREDLILKHAPLVKKIAERMAIRLPPNISKDDLTSSGILGLFDALDNFDADMGIKFQTYAEHRIRGAMLDELRKMDWIPRSVRKEIHKIEDAMRALRYKLKREPEDVEVAEELGVDLETYYKMFIKAKGVGLQSLDNLMEEGSADLFSKKVSETASALDELKKKEIKGIISKAIQGLSKKEQRVISLYYYDELTLKEIASVLGLTESRISQIHSKAIIVLRSKLRSFYES